MNLVVRRNQFSMTSEHALAFLLFSTVAAITPGPSNILLAATGATAGLLRGFPCLLGVTIGMGFMMFVVAFGLGHLVLERPYILELLKWGGVGFLLWLAWKIATAKVPIAARATSIVGFWRAAAFQWINPKSWIVCAGAVGTYLQVDHGGVLGQSALFGGLFVLAAIPSCSVWLAFGAALQRFARSERTVQTFNVVMGVLLVCSLFLVVL
jgi:threonine/homoserine/homoserine lactone efflux protein